MDSLPTLIVVAGASSVQGSGATIAGQTYVASAMDQFDTLDHTLRVGLESGLRVLLVAPPMMADQARKLLPTTDVIDAPQGTAGTSFGEVIAAGVLASAQARGWLLMPVGMPMLRSQTLRMVAQAVGQHPLVIPTYNHNLGLPLGFSSEFFSELIRVSDKFHLSKLVTRYPVHRLEMNDPSILLGKSPDFSFTPWSEFSSEVAHVNRI